MKKIYLKQLFTALLLLCSTAASAYNFELGGIYYNILTKNTVEVTYHGSAYAYSGNVNIPTSVTYNGTTYSVVSIGQSAFYNSVNLISLSIPSTVTSIAEESISNCTALESISVNNNNTVYDSRNNCNAVIETATGILVAGCKNTIIPTEGIKAIGNSAFRDCTNLASIVLPSTIESIGNNAFNYCSNLKNISIPQGVKSIGTAAFSNCTGLASVAFNNCAASLANNAFYNCGALKEVNLGNNITSIGNNVFYNCSSLTTIFLGSNITSIGDNAFGNCYNITSITSLIPADKLFTINSNVFNGTTGSSCTLYVPADAKATYAATAGWSKFTVVKSATYGTCGNNATWKFMDGTLTISGEGTIYKANVEWIDYKNDIKKVVIEDGINYIGGDTFKDHTNLKTVTIAQSLTGIGYRAFSGCTSLTSITIPNNVTSIQEYAFSGCTSLTSITIPNSVTDMGICTFYNCSNLSSVKIGSGLTTIPSQAFDMCTNLTNITIPNTVTRIEGSFSYTGITSFTLPSSVTYISNHSLYGCDNLSSIIVDENNPVYDSRDNCNAIIETATNKLISGCKNTIILDGITSIGDGAFYNFSITEVEIPNSVTSIDEYAFYCSSITKIVSHIPANKLFTIDKTVFNGVIKNTCTLYVPAGAKATYAATEGWSEFRNIKEMIAEPFALTISAAKYATLYLDYDAVIPAGVRVYYAEKIEGETLMMERITDVIPANTAVIVTGAAGTYTFEQSLDDVAAIEKNLFHGSVEDSYITPEKGTKYYVLSIVDGVVGMYLDELAGGTFKNNANKAYLPLSGESLGIFDTTVNSPSAQLSNRYTFNFGGTTAVEVVNAEKANNAIYNLNGVRVENPTKGIYIVNGKKVVY